MWQIFNEKSKVKKECGIVVKSLVWLQCAVAYLHGDEEEKRISKRALTIAKPNFEFGQKYIRALPIIIKN